MLILETTLNQMQDTFTSKKFCSECRKVTDGSMPSTYFMAFLKRKATRMDKYYWRKRVIANAPSNIEEAILLLKTNGFKISKPFVEYKEI